MFKIKIKFMKKNIIIIILKYFKMLYFNKLFNKYKF